MNPEIKYSVPPEYKPLSPWAYFGYSLLFSIPLVGLICIFVFALGGGSNINLRNYARSYFCSMALVVILIVVLLFLGVGLGLTGIALSEM